MWIGRIMTTHLGSGNPPESPVSVWISFLCFSESHNYESTEIHRGQKEGKAYRLTDECTRTHATCPVTSPNSSPPTTNNSCSPHKTTSRRDGSKKETLALCRHCTFLFFFNLVFKVAGKCDGDFPIFPHPSVRHNRNALCYVGTVNTAT